MRTTGDMMEDAFSEDTMMECSGDDAGLDDLVDLTDDISHSAPTIRDAAERLLTLLGVENVENDDSSSTSSEDEGVELDEDSDENDENDETRDEPRNARLLHQLALSLAQELKYSQTKQACKTSARLGTNQHGGRTKNHHETSTRCNVNDQIQRMEVGQEVFCQDDAKSSKYVNQVDETLVQKVSENSGGFFGASSYEFNESVSSVKCRTETARSKNFHGSLREDGKNVFSINSGITDSWTIGWDACATEAIRYLIEDEGLSPHHPTVLAMKSHLEIQRGRALVQYAV